jgi:hypothetical protein
MQRGHSRLLRNNSKGNSIKNCLPDNQTGKTALVTAGKKVRKSCKVFDHAPVSSCVYGNENFIKRQGKIPAKKDLRKRQGYIFRRNVKWKKGRGFSQCQKSNRMGDSYHCCTMRQCKKRGLPVRAALSFRVMVSLQFRLLFLVDHYHTRLVLKPE